VKCEKSFG